MSERPTRAAKRQRPSSTEEEETSEGSEGWNPEPLNNDGPPNHKRPRRAAAQATVMSRSSRSTTNSRGDPSLNITVKASSSKLRHATSAASSRRPPTRGTRTRKPMVEVDTDEDLEEEEEDAEGEDDVEMADADGDADMDAEGEEDDDTPPIHAVSRARAAVRGGRRQNPSVKVTPADEVEEKEVRQNIHDPNEEDDEELSDVDDEEDAEGEEDIDAEGEEEEVVRVGAEDDDDDSDLDSDDDDTPASGSRALTPDLSKLTRRQRAAYQDLDGGLIALSNEAQKKKHFTAEETAMRRAEMARRRKNLSEKRNEEEKMDTINRLLKKQAPKRNRRAGAEIILEAGEEEASSQKPSALFARTVVTKAGTRVAVPEEWIGKPVGRVFDKPVPAPKAKGSTASPWKMVEEVS